MVRFCGKKVWETIFFWKKQPVHSGEMNAPFVGVCKAQGPYVGARAAMGQLDSTCHLGFMSCDSHPSGGKSKWPMESLAKAYRPDARIFLRSAPFPSLFVRGSAIIALPGTQNVLTFNVLALTQITATSIWARLQCPAFPDLLFKRSYKAFASVTWIPSCSSQSRMLATLSSSSGSRITKTDSSQPKRELFMIWLLRSITSCHKARTHSISARASSIARASETQCGFDDTLQPVWSPTVDAKICSFSFQDVLVHQGDDETSLGLVLYVGHRGICYTHPDGLIWRHWQYS